MDQNNDQIPRTPFCNSVDDTHAIPNLDGTVDSQDQKDHSVESSPSKPPGFKCLQTQQRDHMEPNNDQIPRASFCNFVDSVIELTRDQPEGNSNNTVTAKYYEVGSKLGFDSQGCEKVIDSVFDSMGGKDVH